MTPDKLYKSNALAMQIDIMKRELRQLRAIVLDNHAELNINVFYSDTGNREHTNYLAFSQLQYFPFNIRTETRLLIKDAIAEYETQLNELLLEFSSIN
jgi:hypothetical protein